MESPLKGIKNPQLLNLYAYALNNPGRYTDPDGTEPQEPDMKALRSGAGIFNFNKKHYGYDPEKLLDNPRLSPKMTFELHETMARYHQDERLMASTSEKATPDWTTARVTRAFDPSDSGSIYHMGLGADLKIFDKEGRYVDPTTEQGRSSYALYMKLAERRGFAATLVTPDEGQSYIRLQYTPNFKAWDVYKGKLLTNAEVKAQRREMNWHMQDLRKHYWKMAHGSYWRQRYAMKNPIAAPRIK